MAIGIIFLLILQFFGRHTLEILLFAGMLAGLMAMHLVLRSHRLPFVSWLIDNFEREGVRIPGFGSAWYAFGILMASVAISGPPLLAAAICVLAFGDSLSTIFGQGGKHRIPYNPHKTLEGSAAFFLGSLPACLFIGPAAIPLAIVCAIVESLPLPLDDNITIPAAAILFFYFFTV
jgi:dolichol kinase